MQRTPSVSTGEMYCNEGIAALCRSGYFGCREALCMPRCKVESSVLNAEIPLFSLAGWTFAQIDMHDRFVGLARASKCMQKVTSPLM